MTIAERQRNEARKVCATNEIGRRGCRFVLRSSIFIRPLMFCPGAWQWDVRCPGNLGNMFAANGGRVELKKRPVG